MNISTNSWHYRMISFCMDRSYYEMPRNLCSYFWLLVASFLKIIFMVGVLLAGIALFIACLVWTLIGAYRGLLIICDHSLLAWSLATALISILAIRYLYRRSKKRAKKVGDPLPKPPSILLEYLRAKKRKVCPLITYVGDSVSASSN